MSYLHPVVHEALAELRQQHVVERIWQRDHTVWKMDPREITDRLGWLGVTAFMLQHASGVPEIELFAREVREAGFRQAVLLGMGGSSLGAEVLRRTFAVGQGLRLHVLDSTVPSQVRAVAGSIDPARTLFLVSSKSGTTIEPLCLMAYFQEVVREALGQDQAGGAFTVITDPGTPLAGTACRRTFLNPPDIGGRYSVLSYFGLVPAAIAGVDIRKLLERAEDMRGRCSPSVTLEANPGARLGATLGAFARQGRNKLTIIASPGLDSFGLWAEQLIAESTGKEGKGIVPVAGDSAAGGLRPQDYGDDRLFVYLRLSGADNAAADAAVAALREAGMPVFMLEMTDKYDLGAELFRWEFAAAVAGAVLGVQPFNQPDVQSAKSATDRMLQSYAASGRLPPVPPAAKVSELLAGAAPGSYLAITAYLPQTDDTDQALAQMRARVARQYRLATTVGYGPRYLHSTGQLHKGGPAGGLFLQVNMEHEQDLPIPGKPYSFGVLADAQALGDLKALQELGRKVAAARISGPLPAALGRLSDELCRPGG